MEATKEAEATATGGSLIDKILPPRLEDYGLEDCALPPESIKEAFFKAASAVKSRTTSIFADDDPDGDCLHDPWPEDNEASDVVVDAEPGASDALVGVETGVEKEGMGPCVAEKGGGVVEEGRDGVVVGGGDVEEREKERGSCVDGLKGLEIGEKEEEKVKKKKHQGGVGDDEEEESEEDKPILTEGTAMHMCRMQYWIWELHGLCNWGLNSS